MPASEHVTVKIDLARVRANAIAVKQQVGVEVLAVVKADAYGLGAGRVVEAIGDIVDGFCVFSLAEVIEADIWQRTGKPTIALGPNPGVRVDDFLKHHVRPMVWSVERAASLRRAQPIVSIDTGMQRFACPREQVDAVIRAGAIEEASTHATRLEQVERFVEWVGQRGMKLHAAGSGLLGEPTARLDAVRPGFALYTGAVRVSCNLVEVHRSSGPVGYSGFASSHHGVILAGYSHGLRAGPCMINGRRSTILEVGMQSAFVETTAGDRAGDEVILLGETLSESEVAIAWKCSSHEVLTSLCGSGEKLFAGT